MSENVTNISVKCSIYDPDIWITNLPSNNGVNGLWNPPRLDAATAQILELVADLAEDGSEQQNTFHYRAKAAAFSQNSQDLLFTCEGSDEQLVCTIYFNYDSNESERLNPNFRSEAMIVLQSEVWGGTDKALRIKPPQVVDGIIWEVDSYQQQYLTPLGMSSDNPGSFPFAIAGSAFQEKPTLSLRFRAVGSQNGVYECVLDFVDGMSIMLEAGQKEQQLPWLFTAQDMSSTQEQKNAYNFLTQQLGYDPQKAIQNLTTDFGSVIGRIANIETNYHPSNINIEDWRFVCSETIKMLDAAARVRRMFELTDKFITEVYVGNLHKVDRCLELLKANPDSETTMDLSGLLGAAFSVAGALDVEGIVALDIANTLISFVVSQFLIPNPPQELVSDKAKELRSTYEDYFNRALQNSVAQLAVVLKSREAIQIGYSMILSGSLEWPVAKMSQLKELANASFELRIWQALLPLKYVVAEDKQGWARVDGWTDKIAPPYGDGDRYWLAQTSDNFSIHSKICNHLFTKNQDELGTGLGLSFRDLIENNNGWAIKTVKRYDRIRGPLVFESW